MYAFHDPTTITRWATGLVLLYAAANVAEAVVLLALIFAGQLPFGLLAGIAGAESAIQAAQVAVTIACYCVVGRWIYRIHANAWALSGALSDTPGWAVGWFFVPIASFFKPYQAMKEGWFASHFGGGDEGAWLIGLWWALWLASTFLGSFAAAPAAADVAWLGLVACAVEILLSGVLIVMMQRFAAAQTRSAGAAVFA